jgi:hypothetical protein
VFAGGLISGAELPGAGVFEAGEFEDDDFFDCGTFRDLVATMDGAKFAGMFLQAAGTSWRYSFSRDSLRVFSRVRIRYASDSPCSRRFFPNTND